ncbi:MAG: hypothetical protein IPM57_02385 [Oligoflexia bacterium]|nr:hypothetical protein [Oligoflexia bacterium]
MQGSLLFICLVFIFSCAETPDKGASAYSYENNAFYSGQAEAPMRGRGPSSNNFFNKVCNNTGSSNEWGGSQYECYYTDGE